MCHDVFSSVRLKSSWKRLSVFLSMIICLGVEIAPGLEEEKREEGLNKLDTFCLGKLLQGDVVKCSEPEVSYYFLQFAIYINKSILSSFKNIITKTIINLLHGIHSGKGQLVSEFPNNV